jgi:putative hemolysin
MVRILLWGIFGIIVAGLFAVYSGSISLQRSQYGTPSNNAGIANPASEYCVKAGGTLEIATGAGGGQVGYCHLKDGRVCEEWAFFRSGTCSTGQ